MIVARSHTAPTGDSARKNCAAKQNDKIVSPLIVSTDKSVVHQPESPVTGGTWPPLSAVAPARKMPRADEPSAPSPSNDICAGHTRELEYIVSGSCIDNKK